MTNFNLNLLLIFFSKILDKEDMKQVGLFIAVHPEIVKLDLSYNTIGNKGLYQLFNNSICANLQMNHLNLMHCKINNKGLEYLTNIIDRLELKTLRLTGNKLQTIVSKIAKNLLQNVLKNAI